MAGWPPGKNTRNENPLSSVRRACFTRRVKVDLGIWSKLTKVVVGLVVLAVLLLIGMCYLPVIRENERMRRQIMIFQDQIKKEESRSKELQAQVNALLHDPKTVERLTREKLGYAKPDETVVRFEPAVTNAVMR
jgi:cell division protein FtsB